MLLKALSKPRQFLSQHRSFKDAAILFSGKAAVQLIALLSQPILARIYTPTQFGEFAFINSLLAILLVSASGRYELGLILTRKYHQARRLFQLSQLILIGYVILIALILLFTPSDLQQWLVSNGLPAGYLWFVPVLVLCMGYWQIVHNWLVRFQKYSQISIALVIQRVLIFGIAVLAYLFSFSGNGLILALAAGALAILVTSIVFHHEPVYTSYRSLRSYAIHFREFPFFAVPSLYILIFIQHLPVLWISYFFDKSLTGAYSMAYTIVTLPLMTLMMSMGQVYNQRVSQSAPHEQASIVLKYSTGFISILLPFSLIIFFWGAPLFVFLLGEKWQQAGYIASLLAPLALFHGMSSVLMVPLTVYRMQSVSLAFQILRLILFLTALGIGHYYNDVFLSFKLLSLSSFIHFIIVLIIIYRIMVSKHAMQR